MTESYEVLAVRYATRQTDAASVYLNFHMYQQVHNEPLVMDYFFWVVRNSRRTIVVDTGFTPEVGEPRGRVMTVPVPDGLARVGVDPETVDTVVITHGHYDHTGNVNLFPNARVVMSSRELDFWSGPIARREIFAHAVEPGDITYLRQVEEAGRLQRMAGVIDVAPGVTAVEVGGHTPGELIVLVDGEGGEVLLASDAVHYYDEVDLDRPFLMVHDLERMYQAFDVISGLAKREGIAYVAGHDPLVLERFTAIEAGDPGFGVRIR
ncbi:N-acyl homoserine lactonase family protein [Ornithinimicrobium cavernae]|uniref:N-acyl homoserine lactonase family protein n=1 Tax=Ornithinimicrobium cavernae TaxID=2666047 RepID=UPI000D689E92|nr:N-acyl homoserine lactonase family protein [Ornithinimicrobium cavernae]